MDLSLLLLTFPMFIFSLSVHEFAHAWIALKQGDDTASLQGRVTLNPIAHIDPIGTLLMPLLAFSTGVPLLGWARPVPVNPVRMKNMSKGLLYVTIAGPISNVVLVVLIALAAKTFAWISGDGSLAMALSNIDDRKLAKAVTILISYGILINVLLAIFNMLPIPPLDGSKVFFHYFIDGKPHLYPGWESYERVGFIAIYLIILLPFTRDLMSKAYLIPYEYIMRVLM